MSNSNNPYLTVVAASRNDHHGGDIVKRMCLFVKSLNFQCNAFKLPCELILVEWNPVKGAKFLRDVLPGVGKDDFLSMRYIIVPNEVHSSLKFSEDISLYQMIAKNIGIRRASAEFVLCTNVDIIFSTELFERLAKRDLQEHHFYRANRCDIPSHIDESWPVAKQLDFCRQNILQRNGRDSSPTRLSFLKKYELVKLMLRGRSRFRSLYTKPLSLAAARINALDTEACGDFTLMSKKSWVNIEGYPELEIYPLHIDSLGLFAAEALGMKQVIFLPDECIYHITHKGGWEFSTSLERLLFYTKKPSLDYWAAYTAGMDLVEKQGKFGINKPNWGFADSTFEEIFYGH